MDTLLEYAPLATIAMVVLLGIGLWVDRSENRGKKGEWKGHVDKDRETLTDFMKTTQETQRVRDEWETTVDVDRSNFKIFMETIQRQFATLQRQFGTLQRQFGTLQRQFGTLQKQLQEILALAAGGQGPWLAGSSPLRLTAEGQKLSGQLGAGAWAKTATKELATKAKGLEPYELEEMAFDYTTELELPRSMRRVGYDAGVPSGVIRQVLGIELRDELILREGLGAGRESHA